MLKKVVALLIVSALAFHRVAAEGIPSVSSPPIDDAPLAISEQLVLVVTRDWDAVNGVMRRFARTNGQAAWSQSAWKQVGPDIPVVVGRHGLGWGRGLNPPYHLPGPVKKEGDGKSPAGIFRLSSAFGLAAPGAVKNIRLPYRQLTDGVECVDDVKSEHYNSIVDRAATARPDWDSSEKMRAITVQYRLGIVVDHNTDPREAGDGSCIFLHIWLDSKTPTTGCTAMAPQQMEALITWLNPADHPVLVQLPEKAYKHLKKNLRLP